MRAIFVGRNRLPALREAKRNTDHEKAGHSELRERA
jgi:hypothetical protein